MDKANCHSGKYLPSMASGKWQVANTNVHKHIRIHIHTMSIRAIKKTARAFVRPLITDVRYFFSRLHEANTYTYGAQANRLSNRPES